MHDCPAFSAVWEVIASDLPGNEVLDFAALLKYDAHSKETFPPLVVRLSLAALRRRRRLF